MMVSTSSSLILTLLKLFLLIFVSLYTDQTSSGNVSAFSGSTHSWNNNRRNKRRVAIGACDSESNNGNDGTKYAIQNSEGSVTAVAPFNLLLLSQFLLFIGVGAVIPSIPLYGKEIGLSNAANGIVISAPAVALFFASNWSGRRADLARKPAMMMGMAVIVLSDIGTALAQNLSFLILARLGLGGGRALSEAGERGMVADLANQIPEMRGRALAAQQAAAALGVFLGAPVGGVVVERYGPRAAFLCVSVAASIAFIIYAFLPETISIQISQHCPNDNDKTKSQLSSTVNRKETKLNEKTPGGKVWRELLKENQWRGLALCQSGASMGYAAKIASIPILAAHTLPGGAAGAGVLVSAAGLSGLIGAGVGGLVTDKIGSKNTAILGGILSSLGLICIPISLSTTESQTITFSVANNIKIPLELSIGDVLLQSTALFFSLSVLLWSIGASVQGPALTALAQEKCRSGVEATSLSLVKASGDGTYIIFPFILGSVSDLFKPYSGIECALAGSGTLLGTLVLYMLVQETVSSNFKEKKKLK